MKTDKLLHPRGQWRPALDLYPEKKVLAFPNREERDRLLASLWSDSQLFGMPRDYAGALLLIVPDEAVQILQARGFRFVIQDVFTR